MDTGIGETRSETLVECLDRRLKPFETRQREAHFVQSAGIFCIDAQTAGERTDRFIIPLQRDKSESFLVPGIRSTGLNRECRIERRERIAIVFKMYKREPPCI